MCVWLNFHILQLNLIKIFKRRQKQSLWVLAMDQDSLMSFFLGFCDHQAKFMTNEQTQSADRGFVLEKVGK